jgi:hypothetical protein
MGTTPCIPKVGIDPQDATHFAALATLEDQPTVPLTVRFAVLLGDETLYAFDDAAPPFCAFGGAGQWLPSACRPGAATGGRPRDAGAAPCIRMVVGSPMTFASARALHP